MKKSRPASAPRPTVTHETFPQHRPAQQHIPAQLGTRPLNGKLLVTPADDTNEYRRSRVPTDTPSTSGQAMDCAGQVGLALQASGCGRTDVRRADLHGRRSRAWFYLD